jgi:hypothetical protein
MQYLSAVGITVGLLAGAWVYASGVLGMTGFAGFLGWATYFATGQGKEGCGKAVCSNLSGVAWGVLTVFAMSFLPGQWALAAVILAAACMCWQAGIPLLSFIPGTFIGNACFYANGNDWLLTGAGLLCGVLLGLLSDYAARWLSRPKAD